MKKIFVIAAMTCCFLPAILRAQSADQSLAPEVDRTIESQRVAQKIPGLAFAVVRDGKVIHAQSFGLSNVELDVPATPQSIFQTGSVGKQFTATAVMMLVESGQLALTDHLSKYFPEAPDTWHDITIRHLLTHTSGIPDYGGEGVKPQKEIINLRSDYTEDELVKKFSSLPLDFPPGDQWSYSNSGYVILGVLIHRVSGKFYGDFLQERIFKPLGMTSTRIISESDIVPGRAAGYLLVKDQLKNQEWVSPSLNTTADGALYTNVLDLAKWDAALYTDKLLKRESFQQMWTPVTLNDGKTYPYGFGWALHNVNGHHVYEHDGSWQGFTMEIARFVDDRLTFIIMTNLDSAHSDPGKIVGKVAPLYIQGLRAENPSVH